MNHRSLRQAASWDSGGGMGGPGGGTPRALSCDVPQHPHSTATSSDEPCWTSDCSNSDDEEAPVVEQTQAPVSYSIFSHILIIKI